MPNDNASRSPRRRVGADITKENRFLATHFKRAVIVGVGLIGGSLGQALRQRGLAEEVIGVGRSVDNLRDAVRVGAIDDYANDVESVAGSADLIVVATPISQMAGVFDKLAPRITEDVVITDVGSVKARVIELAAPLADRGLLRRFAPSHPIAGTEFSGAAHSFANLFEAHWVIMTPHPTTDADALTSVTSMWQQVGADTQTMGAEEHDSVLAKTSHLPHVLAFALVYQLATDKASDRHFQFVAGGFYDFTRIAASDGPLWRDICFANKAAVYDALDGFGDMVDTLKACLANNDHEGLRQIFDTARNARLQLHDKRKSS